MNNRLWMCPDCCSGWYNEDMDFECKCGRRKEKQNE